LVIMRHGIATRLFFIIYNAGYSLGLHARPAFSERRLEYVGPLFRHAAGMLDRLMMFNILAGLGTYHNASVHLVNFGKGPQAYLDRMHSPTINNSWGHYLEALPFDGVISKKPDCVTFSDPSTNLFHVFDGGVTCVKLAMPFCRSEQCHPDVQQFVRLSEVSANFKPSHAVLSAANRIEQQYDLKSAGAIHIRRCDVLAQNQKCTDPSAVAKQVDTLKGFTSWVVFWYAEAGYKDRLRKRLEKPGRRVLFEDEMPLNPFMDGDNYFQFMVSQELSLRAKVTVETRRCTYGGIVKHSVRRLADGVEAAMDEHLSATCRKSTSAR